MTAYNITFQYSETTYCSNIALGTEAQIRQHYSNYEIVSISEASEYDLQDAQRRGKPVVDCTSEEITEKTAQETTETTEETKQEGKNMDNNTLFEAIRNYLTELDDSEIVTIWNEYARNNNYYDDEIFDYSTLEEMIENSNEGGLYWINRFFYGSDDYDKEGSANPNRDYFVFNGYGNIISFDYIYNKYDDTFHHIEVDDMIDYIIENQDSLYNDGIQEILDEANEEEANEE